MAAFRDRCREMVERLDRVANIDRKDPTDDLMAFVVAEAGRSADRSLEPTLPLCLYFGNDLDREEFIAAVMAAKPGMVAKKMP